VRKPRAAPRQADTVPDGAPRSSHLALRFLEGIPDEGARHPGLDAPGRPGIDPKVNLIGAWSAMAANGYEVFTGGRIEAHHVAWRYAGKDTRNVWSIHIFGTTPLRFRPGVAPAARSHLRHIVDATTGDWVLSTTVPQPDEPTPRLDGKNDVPIPAPGGNAAPGGGG
jgi:hypothetical protein